MGVGQSFPAERDSQALLDRVLQLIEQDNEQTQLQALQYLCAVFSESQFHKVLEAVRPLTQRLQSLQSVAVSDAAFRVLTFQYQRHFPNPVRWWDPVNFMPC